MNRGVAAQSVGERDDQAMHEGMLLSESLLGRFFLVGF
jgi:hypothetical protein